MKYISLLLTPVKFFPYLVVMPTLSAGLLMFRKRDGEPEFFLVHPGGPFFRKKNEGVWSIPKGIPEPGEDLLETAQREFFEETGISPAAPFHPLGSIQQQGGKIVHAWAFQGAWNPESGIKANEVVLEFPPRSGKQITFPEADRAEWMTMTTAVKMINPKQIPFLERAKTLVENDEHIKN